MAEYIYVWLDSRGPAARFCARARAACSFCKRQFMAHLILFSHSLFFSHTVFFSSLLFLFQSVLSVCYLKGVYIGKFSSLVAGLAAYPIVFPRRTGNGTLKMPDHTTGRTSTIPTPAGAFFYKRRELFVVKVYTAYGGSGAKRRAESGFPRPCGAVDVVVWSLRCRKHTLPVAKLAAMKQYLKVLVSSLSCVVD